MSRIKASFIHLLVSVTILAFLSFCLSKTWYPPEYIGAVGGFKLIALLAGVDACLGPLLTLVVWDVSKPRLRFDMTVIAALQILGMAYGLYSVFLARPVYMVFAVDRFELVAAAEITAQALSEAKSERFKTLPLLGPQVIAAIRPDDPRERENLLFSAAGGGADLHQLPKYFADYTSAIANVLGHAKPLAELTQNNAANAAKIEHFLRERNIRADQVRYVPLRARQDQTAIVGAQGTVEGIVDIDPWETTANK